MATSSFLVSRSAGLAGFEAYVSGWSQRLHPANRGDFARMHLAALQAEEIVKQLLALHSQNRLRVELHPVNRMFFVA